MPALDDPLRREAGGLEPAGGACPADRPERLPAARAVHPVYALVVGLGHAAPDGRLAEGPRPGREGRQQGHGVAHGQPLPEGAGQHRDPAAAVGEDLDGGGPHAHQQLPAVPSGARHVLAPVDHHVAAPVRLGPDPPHGVGGTPGKASIPARSSRGASAVGLPTRHDEEARRRAHPSASIAFSSAIDPTDGTGASGLRRRSPTAFSSEPLSLPE